MRKSLFWYGVIVLLLSLGLCLSGCTTFKVSSPKATSFEKRPLGLAGVPKYSVLGSLTYETNWYGYLGVSTPSLTFPFGIIRIPNYDIYLYQNGGFTYADLLEKAKKQYPEADAVIDINVDYKRTHYWILHNSKVIVVSAIAIKYSRDEVGGYPTNAE